jgi:hypothetical protein
MKRAQAGRRAGLWQSVSASFAVMVCRTFRIQARTLCRQLSLPSSARNGPRPMAVRMAWNASRVPHPRPAPASAPHPVAFVTAQKDAKRASALAYRGLRAQSRGNVGDDGSTKFLVRTRQHIRVRGRVDPPWWRAMLFKPNS